MQDRKLVFVTLLLLGGCVGNATFVPSKELENSSWSSYLKNSGLIDTQRIDARWWTSYQDEMLNQLIESALKDNLNLKIARSKIREARAFMHAELAVTRPQLSSNASVTDQKLSENGSLPVGRIAGFEKQQTIYQAGFDAAWEIDLFGRNPKRREIASSRFKNEQELQYDLHLSVAAEVARNYIQLRNMQAQKKITLQSIDRQQRIIDVLQALWDNGEASMLDVDRAQVLLAEYQAQSYSLEAAERGFTYQLSLLTGQAPDALSGKFIAPNDMPTHIENSLLNASSDLLRRRADVRNAERLYIIANQQQELAKLAIYPTFSLFARGGPNTVNFNNFFEHESIALDLGGLVHWPLYNGGRLRAQSAASKERVLQAEYFYANAVLIALQELETISSSLIETKKELAARKLVDNMHRRIADSIRQRYEAGVSDLLAWLTAEQQFMQSQKATLSIQAQLLLHSIALHKAFGGGWLLLDEDVSQNK